VNAVDREGTWSGFDLKLVQEVSEAVDIPVIATGGAGSLDDVRSAVFEGGASAVAIGSMAVFQAKDLGVLIKFPTRRQQEAALEP
jgi:cyclase